MMWFDYVLFVLLLIWLLLKSVAALKEIRYWKRMTAMFIRPTLDKKDFGLFEDDED